MSSSECVIRAYIALLPDKTLSREARLREARAHAAILAKYVDEWVSVPPHWERYERATGERRPTWVGVGRDEGYGVVQ